MTHAVEENLPLAATHEHPGAVEDSHARHDPLAADFGSFFGVPEHLLKFTANVGDTLVCTLQFHFVCAVSLRGMLVHVPPFEKAGTQK